MLGPSEILSLRPSGNIDKDQKKVNSYPYTSDRDFRSTIHLFNCVSFVIVFGHRSSSNTVGFLLETIW